MRVTVPQLIRKVVVELIVIPVGFPFFKLNFVLRGLIPVFQFSIYLNYIPSTSNSSNSSSSSRRPSFGMFSVYSVSAIKQYNFLFRVVSMTSEEENSTKNRKHQHLPSEQVSNDRTTLSTVDRQKVCPMYVRMFCRLNGHHRYGSTSCTNLIDWKNMVQIDNRLMTSLLSTLGIHNTVKV